MRHCREFEASFWSLSRFESYAKCIVLFASSTFGERNLHKEIFVPVFDAILLIDVFHFPTCRRYVVVLFRFPSRKDLLQVWLTAIIYCFTLFLTWKRCLDCRFVSTVVKLWFSKFICNFNRIFDAVAEVSLNHMCNGQIKRII